jgi:hypothetical protein
MATFNEPMSITIYDNNPIRRYEQNNLKLVKFHDKFFNETLLESDSKLRKLDYKCRRFINQKNYTKCGELIPGEFPGPADTEGMSPAELIELDKERLKWLRVDHRRVKLVPFTSGEKKEFDPNIHYSGIDSRVVYIADAGNHCIRRILIKQANVDTFAGICGVPGFKDGIYG